MMVNIDSFIDFFIAKDNYLWFIDGKNYGVFRIDILNSKVEFVEALPERIKDIRMFNSGSIWENKLIFSPYNCDAVLLYDLCSGDFEKILIKEKLSGKAQFSNTLIEGNMLIMVDSYKEHVLLVFDLIKRTYELYEFGSFCHSNTTLSRDIAFDGKRVYLACLEDPVVLLFDLETKQFSKIQLEKLGGFGTIAFAGDHLLLSDNNSIIKLRLDGGHEIIYSFNDECNRIKESIWNNKFFRSFFDGIYIWFIPTNQSDIYRLDVKAKTCELMPLISELNFNTSKYTYLPFLGCSNLNEELFLYSTQEKTVYIVNKSSFHFKKIAFELNKKAWLDCMIKNREVISENKSFGLLEFESFVGEECQ